MAEQLTHHEIADAFNNRGPYHPPHIWGYRYAIQDTASQTDSDIGTIRYLWVYFVNDAGEKISNVVKSATYYWFKYDHPTNKYTREEAKNMAYMKLVVFMSERWHFQSPDLPNKEREENV